MSSLNCVINLPENVKIYTYKLPISGHTVPFPKTFKMFASMLFHMKSYANRSTLASINMGDLEVEMSGMSMRLVKKRLNEPGCSDTNWCS